VTTFDFPRIDFDSELVETAFSLERMRGEIAIGSTPRPIYFELHGLFQFLASVISARIEGNHTTILDAVAGARVAATTRVDASDAIKEILNIQRAMAVIDGELKEAPINHGFVRHLHELVVEGLVREGDPTPGSYRSVDVAITRADHRPPAGHSVQPDMDALLEFINRPVPAKFQLIHVALAHHRFLWVHPFQNGNGRVSRLLSYAMLGRHGFVSPIGLRAVNPTAVFGVARDDYYSALGAADDLGDEGTVAWCSFFLGGLLSDLTRLHALQHFQFVKGQLIEPALDRFVAAGLLTANERAVLSHVFANTSVKAGSLTELLPGSASSRSQALRALIDRGLLAPQKPGGRFYHLAFTANDFTPFVIGQLDVLGFLPPLLKDER
jgi:Fic family protein